MKKLEKPDKPKKGKFFKDSPQKLIELLRSVSAKIFDPHPFSLLTTKKNKDYANLIVKKYGVKEKVIRQILIDLFEADSIFRELLAKDHEMRDQGKKIVKQYSKAIEALQTILKDKLAGIGIEKSIKGDIDHLKKERAELAGLHLVHPEFRAEFARLHLGHPKFRVKLISNSAIAMFKNQVYSLFVYIRECFNRTHYHDTDQNIYELISELCMAIYDHPAFHASEKFKSGNIKHYCDNMQFHSKKKTSLHKYIETLLCVK